ncbi:MAG: TrpB-like pyridoxal phosphate-dependent enzyme, partial [Asgard group archaeon]|nr:TrpB-like pyridoxal phosphate-dependent enzyme [Asgard group archaeon]
MTKTNHNRIDLPFQEMPVKYYNILADINKVSNEEFCPPLNPQTLEPATAQELEAIFPKSLIQQETSTKRYIDIPLAVQEVYSRYRPSPLYHAERFEKALKTRAKIYFKYEGVSPPGSHKPNTAIPQAYYNMKEGVEKLYTETGAGQWGTALAFAGLFFDLDIEVYMVRISYDQKPHRRTIMNLFGANVYPSPSKQTKIGKEILKKEPDTPGSLGIAISEAIEKVLEAENAKYALGSVLNHVLLHQTIIGLET